MKKEPKYKNVKKGIYKSNLESNCAKLLTAAKLEYKYEPMTFTLIPKGKIGVTCYEKTGKTFKRVGTIRATTYTPDFVGSNWIIETKGMITPDFRIK